MDRSRAGLALAAVCCLTIAAFVTPRLPADLIDATNQLRARHGLMSLREDPRLNEAARVHCEQMLREGRLDHGSSQTALDTPAKRVAAAGLSPRVVGENVAWHSGPLPSGELIVNNWLLGWEHRGNLLNGRFTRVGVAALCGGQECFVTQVFASE